MHYVQADFLDQLNAQLSSLDSEEAKINSRVEVYILKSMGSSKKLYKQLEKQYQDDFNAKQIAIQSSSKYSTLHYSNNADDFCPSSASPPSIAASSTAIGPISDSHSRKMLFYLISTLNMSFPNYEFSTVKQDHFVRHSINEATQSINHYFSMATSHLHDHSQHVLRKFWSTIEEAIGPHSPPDITNKYTTITTNEDVPKRQRGNSISSHSHIHPSLSNTTIDSFTNISKLEWDTDVEVYSYEPDESSGAGDPYEDEDDGMIIWKCFYFFYNRRHKRILFFTMKASVLTHPAEDDGGALGEEEEGGNSFGSFDYDDNEKEEGKAGRGGTTIVSGGFRKRTFDNI